MKYAAPGLFLVDTANPESTISVRALLFYEGDHIDSIGKKLKFSADRVRKMAEATNEYLASGRRAKFFADHEYAQKNVLGAIEGEVEAREIDTVPHEGMRDLIGKIGIYATVQIAGEENVVAYGDKRIKEISVGIDLDGKMFGIKNAIYELSAVGIPALAGAALFGLTIGETVQEVENQRDLWEEWDVFTTVLSNISRATDEEVQATGMTREGLRSKAVDDHAARLKVRFPVSVPPTVPLFEQQMQYTEDELKTLAEKAAKFDAAQAELVTMKRSQEVSSRFNRLKDKAIGLRSAGKLPPAQFKTFGFDDAEASVAKFSAGDDRALDKLEIQLETIEQYATPVKMGSYLHGEPIPGEESNTEDDYVKSFFAAHKPKPSWVA